MPNIELKRIWLAVLVGLLAATSNGWLMHPNHASTYDAPWVHPNLEHQP